MFKKALILTSDADQFDFSDNNIDVYNVYEKYKVFLRAIRRIWFLMNFPFKFLWYGNWKNRIEEYDFIVVDDGLFGMEIFSYIRKKNLKAKLIFWHFGIVSSKRHLKYTVEYMRENSCEEWSFDKSDCEKYNMRYNIQFYNKLKSEISDGNEEIDVFFIGLNKNRVEQLVKIRNFMQDKGLITKFIIVKDKSKTNKNQKKYMQNNGLSYNEIIDLIKRSKCVLEFNQEGQSGLTRRTLESLFFGKKLITNNRNIISYDFYNKNNIFIIGIDDMNNIKEFLENPYKKINETIISNYTYKKWLENFFVKQ